MCGFGGVINSKTEVSRREIAAVASSVNFRGPDSCGICVLNRQLTKDETGNTALFFNRLAIIDLDSRSDQPFEDEHHLLMFNGEIYNYTELRRCLEKDGIVFRTTSDTEVLFYVLKTRGREGIRELNGMFAFCWLDKRNGNYIIARDRLGIKPLYYHTSNGSCYFSSELHSILRMMNSVPQVAAQSVQMYLWFQFVPTPNSVFEGIYKLPPGSFLAGNAHEAGVNPVIASYWDVYDEVTVGRKEDPAALESILCDSVKRQLQADVPIGLFLSSGVDSSLLAAIVNKYFANERDVNFFTVSFGEATSTDESADSKSFIDGFNNPHLVNHLLRVSPRYLQDQLNELYNYYDEPFGDYAALLNWAISKKARDFVTVALSGDGADELFWGYSRYNKWQDLGRYNRFPALSRTFSKTAELLPAAKLRNKVQNAFVADPVQRHLREFLMPEFRNLFSNDHNGFDIWATTNLENIRERNDLPGILDLKTYLADAMLYKVDRSSMATSLEVRVPYLDDEVLEFALSLDLSYKSNHKFRNKAILKELLLKLAPHYNAHRPKKGFSFPLRSWLQTHWKDQVLASITPQRLNGVGLPSEPFMTIVKDFYTRQTPSHIEVWYLFNLVLWKEKIDSIHIVNRS